MDLKGLVSQGYGKFSYNYRSDDGRFHTIDISQLAFPDEQFAAIVSFYTIIHLPLVEHRRLGGYFMATVSYTAWTSAETGWLEAEMGPC